MTAARFTRSTLRRHLLAAIPCVVGLLIGLQYLQLMNDPLSTVPPFADANTYLAAGERLNAGHDLYTLGPGDRPVLILPEISSAALLSPPPIAVIWRPIAALPFGLALWVAAAWLALLGTTYYLVLRTGLRGAVVATALAPAIGEQLAACNVAAFFPFLLTLAWVLPGWRSGLIVGVMASLKLAPAAMIGWLVGTGSWRGVGAACLAIVVAIGLSLVGAGPDSLVRYVEVARMVAPSASSLSGITGVAWLSPAILIGGTIVAVALGRWPAWSFIVAVIASVLGTPALYLSGFVTLLATLAPAAAGMPAREEPSGQRAPSLP